MEFGQPHHVGIATWQSANHLPCNAIVDDATWKKLLGAPVPQLSQRALQPAGDWEGTGYGGSNGNFDGQGIMRRVTRLTWGNGELQDILREIRASCPQIFSDPFESNEQKIVDVLASEVSDA